MNQGIGITQGIISLPLMEIVYNDLKRNVIQSDLVITEGNSGGALLNDQGELIGITTFRIKDKNGLIIFGLAYSIPIDIVENYLKKF